MEVLQAAGDLEIGDDIYPISAKKGTGVEPLMERLRELLPEGPFYYDPAEESDQTEATLLAELIREQVLRRTFQEVPHAVEVIVDDIDAVRDDLIRVTAFIWVETNSQKGILIGSQGKMIKAIGTAATAAAEFGQAGFQAALTYQNSLEQIAQLQAEGAVTADEAKKAAEQETAAFERKIKTLDKEAEAQVSSFFFFRFDELILFSLTHFTKK
jgi:predicted RNA-binding protein YlqC (UPF0109 family)